MMRTNSSILPVCELATAAGLVVFWLVFFFFDLSPQNPPECYLAYERAFPVPDLILALVLVLAALFSLRGKVIGSGLSIAAGGALCFLGVVDLSFNLQNGVYLSSALDFALNAFINLWSVGFGVVLVVFFSRLTPAAPNQPEASGC